MREDLAAEALALLPGEVAAIESLSG
jgi:hypothetical protein